MSTEVDVYENLSDNVIVFDSKEEFIQYYRDNHVRIDAMATRGLNTKFKINGYKIGRKNGKITLMPCKTAVYSKKPVTKTKRAAKRTYHDSSSSSEEPYYTSDSDTDSDSDESSSEDYYPPPKRTTKTKLTPKQAIQKAATRATTGGKTNYTPEKKMNKLNGRVKQLELAMNDMYNKYSAKEEPTTAKSSNDEISFDSNDDRSVSYSEEE